MNVLINAPGIDLDQPRGGTVHQLELAMALKRYVDVTLVSQGTAPAGIDHIRIPTARMPWLTYKSYKAISATRPDLVHDRGFLLGGGGVYAARRLGIPSVVQVDDNWFAGDRFSSPRLWKTGAYGLFTKWWVRRYINLADEAFAVSSSLKETMLRDWGCTKPVEVIPNGVNVAKFSIKPDKATMAKHNPDGRPLAVFVGELAPWQGVDDILSAAERLKGTKFLIVGGQKTHSGHIELLKARAKGLTNVEFTGIVPHGEVPKLLSIADVCLAPFTDKGLDFGFSPLKIFEYLAAGKPVVCTDLSWIREISGLDSAAVFCRPSDPDGLAGAISSVLTGADRRKALGRNAARLARERYDWDIVARKIVGRYKALLG